VNDESSISVWVGSGGDLVSLPQGSTGLDLAERLAKEGIFQPGPDRPVAMRLNGSLVDLSRVLHDGDRVELIAADSPEGLEVIRHSTAHLMAKAVLELWPGTRLAIGPSIENGFYYDFDLAGKASFDPEDLERIEAKMREIASRGERFWREEISLDEARSLFVDQPYKLEIIEAVGESSRSHKSSTADEELSGDLTPEMAKAGSVSIYRTGADFFDLCRGPHVPDASYLGSFKLLRLAGAYWRGDERRPQLQRIYGTAWATDSDLDAYLQRLAEAERRDHRRIGAELDLFHFPSEIGGGLPVFHPKGALIRYLLEEFSRKQHLASGYELVWTPHITRSDLFEISGHLQWYAEGMYPPMEMEGARYYPKPMNCPMHILIYRSRARSYRELPLRLFELGTVYRYERSGVLHGLVRVRGITQDDAHIFCTPDQLEAELIQLIDFVLQMLTAFGLGDFEAELSTRPEKFVGDPKDWERATAALAQAAERAGIPLRVAEGEGAFYAPKLDVHVKDAIGRRWQLSTLQVDLQMPQRFDLGFVGADNQRRRPYMIHRALFGSVERFLGILLEHYAGWLPTWLSPEQVRVVPVRSDHETYGRAVVARLVSEGLRASLAAADETLGARVRKAKLDRVPWLLVVGERDQRNGTVGCTPRQGPTRQDVPLEACLAELLRDARLPVLGGGGS
jgi:threonyl-tRNA synthetase